MPEKGNSGQEREVDSMNRIKNAVQTARALTRREEGHAAAWTGGGLITILLVVLLLILIF